MSADTTSEAQAWLAAIVESSDDAILSKTLDSIILTWNAGAERLFGYTAEEAIGRSVTMLIPEDRLSEEDHILGRLRAGERVDHFETIRLHKDGSLIDVSLTISPVRNAAGEVIGASKIARDISELKQSRSGQSILLREMNHRIKNIFSVIGGLVALSSRASDGQLGRAILSRLEALGRAHELTLPDLCSDTVTEKTTSFAELLRTIVAPHELDEERVSIHGEDVSLSGPALTSIALLLHELTTNAAKYGAFSTPGGRLHVVMLSDGDTFHVDWTERGGPKVASQPEREGFGSVLEAAALRGLRGSLTRTWDEAGLRLALCFPIAKLSG
ncbi:MAG: PAS domain S-box protein [Sphingomonadaceae bacterium]|nr:PAS domain S-box protein [Sphingomonadaceae bacterium]